MVRSAVTDCLFWWGGRCPQLTGATGLEYAAHAPYSGRRLTSLLHQALKLKELLTEEIRSSTRSSGTRQQRWFLHRITTTTSHFWKVWRDHFLPTKGDKSTRLHDALSSEDADVTSCTSWNVSPPFPLLKYQSWSKVDPAEPPKQPQVHHNHQV